MDDHSLHCLWLGAAGKALQRVNTAVSDNFDPLQINFTVVPATVLFALPGIRSLMPSIPGFGVGERVSLFEFSLLSLLRLTWTWSPSCCVRPL